jgi:hypothetical protein
MAVLTRVCGTEEWRYVEREVEIRLTRSIGPVNR